MKSITQSNTGRKPILIAIAGATLLGQFALASGTAHAGNIVMEPNAGPNPVVISGTYELDPAKRSVKLASHCNAYPSLQPLGVLKVNADIADVKIAADGYLIALVSETGEVTCANNQYRQNTVGFVKRPLRAGTYKIFVGDQVNRPTDQPRTATVKFLNTKRGFGFAWEKEIKPRTVGATLPEPIQVDGKTSAEATWSPLDDSKNQCVGLKIGATPALVVDVTEDVSYHASIASTEDVHVVVAGPMPDTAKELPSSCRPVGPGMDLPAKEGRYVFYAGAKAGVNAAYSIVLLDSDKSKRSPATMTPHAGIGRDLEHRAVTRVFPQLRPSADLTTDDVVREKVLAAMSLENFVYATKDFTELHATVGLQRTSEGDTVHRGDKFNNRKLPDATYPKKNEPLLYLGGDFVLTVDGVLFEVKKHSLLAIAPKETAQLPGQSRVAWATLHQSLKLAGPADKKIVAAVEADTKKWNKCAYEVRQQEGRKIGPVNAKAQAMTRRSRNTRAERAAIQRQYDKIATIQNWAKAQEEKVCKTKAHHARNEAARLKLMKSRAQKHGSWLDAMRKRFASK